MKYDVIIVGAGSAGAVLATRLSEDPQRSVLLLEAGPDYPAFEHLPEEIKFGFDTATRAPPVRTPAGHPISLLRSPHNWQFVARATAKAPPMPVPRGRVTGGSSAINTSAFYRGLPDDFDGWAAGGNDQWSFDNILPYFRAIETDVDCHEEYHGSDGPIFVHHAHQEQWHPTQWAFYNACRATDFPECPDHNRPDASGVGPSISNNHHGIRFSTALGYLGQCRHRLNLTIRPNCLVHHIVFDGKRAVGVAVQSGGEMFTVEGAHIVLSAGAVGSPHLLLLSGVGTSQQLSAVLTKYLCKQGHGDRLCAMKPPLYIRHITDEERAALGTGLRSHEAFTVRRCQIVLASAEGQTPLQIATTLHCAPQTVRNVIHAFAERGLACVQHGSNVPFRVEPVLNAEKREQ